MPPRLFVATKAFITYQGKVLLLRESNQYADGSNTDKFDIVGGRLEPGQNFKESLLREIMEETGLNVEVGKPFFVNEWRPVVRGEQWQIVGIFFECATNSDKVKLSQDHDAFAWIEASQYKEHAVIENLSPAFEEYLHRHDGVSH